MLNLTPHCVDANLVVSLVSNPDDRLVRPLWDQWVADGRRLVAPLLLRYEVTNALHRLRRAGAMDTRAVETSLRAMLALPLQLHDEAALHGEALRFAERSNLPAAYDAHYLALAQRLGAELWTADRRLLNAVRPHLSWVHLVGG